MICYQENTHFSQALPCNGEEFWREVRKTSTGWRIDARRAILAAVEASKTEGTAAIQTWLDNSEYQKFCIRKQGMKKQAAREAWEKKTDGERLLSFAQDLKENLPAIIFCCREFDETPTENGKMFRHRRLVDCHLNGLVMLDIDHVENPMHIWYKLKENEALMARTVLVHITSSGQGLRIIFTADGREGNLADNQIVFARALGYQADDSCIDATRNSFAPKEEDILFINEEKLFDYYDEEFDREYTPMYREKKTQPLHHQFDADDGADSSNHPQAAAVAGKVAEQGPVDAGAVDDKKDEGLTWHGYDIQGIIDAWSAQRFGDGTKETSRHEASLVLAKDLYVLFDRDKEKTLKALLAQRWVQDIIAERDEDVERTVSNAADYVAAAESEAAKKGKNWTPKPSKEIQGAIEVVTGKKYKDIAGLTIEANATSLDAKLEEWGAEIEELFEHFPMLKDVCAGLKRSQYPAAVFVAGGVMMTLMTRCWYRFYHRPQQERRLNCSLFVIGHPASNKSMADDLYKILASPIVSADKAGLQALNRYKDDLKKKASNKEGKEKPKGIIRIHPARTSNGQLITDMLNARENVAGRDIQLHLFTFDTELDNSIQLQKGGSWIDKQTLELKAFHNEEDGQMYANLDSPVDNFNVTWNYIYTGTPLALKKKVNERNFGSGLSTRLAVLPMPKTNFEMIDFEEVNTTDWQRMDRMKTWAFKLDTRYGELPFWGIVKRLYQWTKNRMEDCQEDNSEANELMLKRVPYHALNYAAPFIDMRHWQSLHQEGRFWTGEYETDETDWRLCELIATIQYATQQHFFGVMAEKYFDDMNNDVQITGKRHQQKSVDGYNRLPEVFTDDDIARCFGYDNPRSVKTKIRRLKEMCFVEIIADGEDQGKYRKKQKMMT